MHRAIAIAVAGASLAGCSSYSLDSFKPTPPSIQLQLESVPSGADALTSIGPGCKTPCSVAVNAPDAGFTVTFNMPKFQPVTVPVQVQRNPGDLLSPVINPNPVVAELKPAGPPPRAARKPMRPKKPKKPKGDAAPAPDAGTPFPAPAAAPAAAPPPPATQPAR
jgi:hypothetical protein